MDAAQKTYDQALTVREESLTAAKRAIEDAMMPEPADNTQEIKQGEIAQTEEKMESWNAWLIKMEKLRRLRKVSLPGFRYLPDR